MYTKKRFIKSPNKSGKYPKSQINLKIVLNHYFFSLDQNFTVHTASESRGGGYCERDGPRTIEETKRILVV